MLDQLISLVARLEVYAAEQAPDLRARTAARQDLPANVIQLRH
jgi:hypothetical protein